jgi:hypothetical protein
MNDKTSELSRIERWMQTVIMHPGGIHQGIASENARRHIDVRPDQVESIVTRSSALAAGDRLAIYSRAYRARLLDCLRAEFPVLLHALGTELFDQFAFDYLERHPSRSYTLARLGERFPGYLADTRPDRDAPTDSRESWPDFIIDLATLEREFSEVFDGPGVEGQPVVTESEVSELLNSAGWPEATLVTVPCLRLLTFRYPVNNYFVAARRNENPELPGPALTLLAVTRRDYTVYLYELQREQYELLSALIAGESLERAIERAELPTGCDRGALTANLHDCLNSWVALGFFSAMELSDRANPKRAI